MLKIQFDNKHLKASARASRFAQKKGIPVRPDIAAAMNVPQEDEAPVLATNLIAEGKCTGVIRDKVLWCPPTCPRHNLKSDNLDRRSERPLMRTTRMSGRPMEG